VILVDKFSGSASEDMTAGLQEAGRAFVIGKTTMGEDLDANLKELPDGGLLVYPFGLSTTPKGVVIEGLGVIPDLTVDLKRFDLLAGRDTQLQAAISYLQNKK
jgi:carboxyl-terminal processing protease